MTFEELNKKIENAGKAISSLPENRRGANNGAYFYGVGNQGTAHAQADLNSSVSGSSAKLITEMGLDPQKYEIGVLRGGRAYNVPAAIEDAKLNARFLGIEEKISNDKIAQQEAKYNTLAQQIQSVIGGSGSQQGVNAGPEFNQALTQLSAGRNYGSSDLGTMLNFQVSDKQIVDDYNNSKLSRLNSVIERGNTQIAGIQERLNAANQLLAGLPAGDARRTGSEVFIKQLSDDLKSVTSAVTEAQDMQKNFKPINFFN